MANLARGDESCKTALDELHALLEWKENLSDKIERGFWCLNLHLLDGIDRQELDALAAEVARFRNACASLSWREAA